MDVEGFRRAERQLFADAGISPQEHWMTLEHSGARARVLEVGDGAPVLFLHGGPDAASTWAYLAAALPGFRCLLLDRPGCGLSDPPNSVPDAASLPEYVEQLTVDVLDALDLPTASLVGCSFGGYSALRSAAANPSRVERVYLAGCPAFVPGWTAPSFFTLLRTPLMGKAMLRLPVTAASTRMSLRLMGHQRSLDEGRIREAMLQWVRSWQAHTDTMRNDAAMIRACGSWLGGFDPALDLAADDLARVKAPCHISVGTSDIVGQAPVAEGLAALLPDAEVEVLNEFGHLPWLDDPGRVAASISAFLRRPSPDPPSRSESGERRPRR